jgi:hypothetical protein
MANPYDPSDPAASADSPAATDPGDVFVANPDDLFDDEPDLPGWTKPVGIISIVLGSLGVLCGAAIPLQGWMNSKFLGGLEGGAPDVLLNPPAINYVVGVVGLIGAILLLVAGIMCLLRNYKSRWLFLAYAVIGVISTLWSMKLQLDMQEDIRTWMEANPDAQFTQMQQQSGATGALFGLACTGVIGLPWPAFCLFWFGFVKTRPEDFTGGADLDAI